MLSKYNYFSKLKSGGLIPNKREVFCAADVCRIIESEIGCAILTVNPIEKDFTLGIVFKVVTKNGLFFLKTHADNAECRSNLIKESHIFRILYDDVVFCKTLEFEQRNFLFMEELCDASSSPETIMESMLEHRRKLRNHDAVSINYTFESLLEVSDSSLHHLYDNLLVNKQIYDQCVSYFEILKNANLETCICHGDLSNKNIKQKGDMLILIDWEDAFVGPVYYDFLYWLTFFDNKEHLTKENIKKVPYDLEISIALLLLIVIVKCEISFLNNSYLNNKVSFDDRLHDVLVLGK